MDAFGVEQFQVTAGGMTKRLLLARIDRLRRAPELLPGPRADFDKDQDRPATADKVDFASRRAVVAGEHPVPVTPQKRGRDPLTIIPDLPRRPQPRSGQALGSVETIADELEKGREG